MRFVAGQEISIEALEKSRSRAVPELSGDIKFRSIASRDNEALGEPWHRLQPRQRFGQSRFRNRESLAHVDCRCLMAEAKTKYAHLTPALLPPPNDSQTTVETALQRGPSKFLLCEGKNLKAVLFYVSA